MALQWFFLPGLLVGLLGLWVNQPQKPTPPIDIQNHFIGKNYTEINCTNFFGTISAIQEKVVNGNGSIFIGEKQFPISLRWFTVSTNYTPTNVTFVLDVEQENHTLTTYENGNKVAHPKRYIFNPTSVGYFKMNASLIIGNIQFSISTYSKLYQKYNLNVTLHTYNNSYTMLMNAMSWNVLLFKRKAID